MGVAIAKGVGTRLKETGFLDTIERLKWHPPIEKPGFCVSPASKLQARQHRLCCLQRLVNVLFGV